METYSIVTPVSRSVTSTGIPLVEILNSALKKPFPSSPTLVGVYTRDGFFSALILVNVSSECFRPILPAVILARAFSVCI